jgi:hypothetical protein
MVSRRNITQSRVHKQQHRYSNFVVSTWAAFRSLSDGRRSGCTASCSSSARWASRFRSTIRCARVCKSHGTHTPSIANVDHQRGPRSATWRCMVMLLYT